MHRREFNAANAFVKTISRRLIYRVAMLLATALLVGCTHAHLGEHSPSQYLLVQKQTVQKFYLVHILNFHGLHAPAGGGLFLLDRIPDLSEGPDINRIFTGPDSTAIYRTRTLFHNNASLATHLSAFLNRDENQDKTFWLVSTCPNVLLAVSDGAPVSLDVDSARLESQTDLYLPHLRLINAETLKRKIKIDDIVELSIDAPSREAKILRRIHIGGTLAITNLITLSYKSPRL